MRVRDRKHRSAEEPDMRQGRVYRRCTRCGRGLTGKSRHCPNCSHDRFTWAYVVDIAPPGAPRDRKHHAGFATKSEALTALHELQNAVARGSYVLGATQIEDEVPVRRH